MFSQYIINWVPVVYYYPVVVHIPSTFFYKSEEKEGEVKEQKKESNVISIYEYLGEI
jgi:hypothetical protein